MKLTVDATRSKWNYEQEEGRILLYGEYEVSCHGDHSSLAPERFKSVLA